MMKKVISVERKRNPICLSASSPLFSEEEIKNLISRKKLPNRNGDVCHLKSVFSDSLDAEKKLPFFKLMGLHDEVVIEFYHSQNEQYYAFIIDWKDYENIRFYNFERTHYKWYQSIAWAMKAVEEILQNEKYDRCAIYSLSNN